MTEEQLGVQALIERWANAEFVRFVSRSGGQYSTGTICRDSLVLLVDSARAAERAKLLRPIDAALRLAVERTRDDLGPTGDNYPAIRKLLDFAERAIQSERA